MILIKNGQVKTMAGPEYQNGYVLIGDDGKILSVGAAELVCDGCRIAPTQEHELYVNTECPAPYFYLDVGTMVLPWALDEPMQDVISPANVPPFLKRMWNKMLKRQPKSNLTS